MSADSGTLIHAVVWGEITVSIDGVLHRFRDCKVWPGGATGWDWKLTGTHHQPGIQPSDIQELIDQGVEMLVLSRGMQLMLHTCPETIALLDEHGIAYRIEETTQAVEVFNQLSRAGVKVGGIFHSTC